MSKVTTSPETTPVINCIISQRSSNTQLDKHGMYSIGFGVNKTQFDGLLHFMYMRRYIAQMPGEMEITYQ